MGPLRNKRILENPIVGPTAIVDSQIVFFDVCNASGHEYSVCPPQLDILLSKVLFICMSRRLMKVDIISKPKFLSHRSSVIISCVNVDIAAHQNTILCSIHVHIIDILNTSVRIHINIYNVQNTDVTRLCNLNSYKINSKDAMHILGLIALC